MTPDGYSDVDARLRAVHQVWSTFRERGPEAVIELLHPDVELVDPRGRRYRGHEGVRAFFRGYDERGERFLAAPFTFELHEPDVLVVGHVRVRSEQGTRGDYLYFLHGVREGKVARIVAHRSRQAALDDAAARARDEGGSS